jgi:hypothetical protein
MVWEEDVQRLRSACQGKFSKGRERSAKCVVDGDALKPKHTQDGKKMEFWSNDGSITTRGPFSADAKKVRSSGTDLIVTTEMGNPPQKVRFNLE